jgi:predicted nucleic acid-binding protein
MRVVDTSAWIEWLIGSALGKRLASDFPPQGEWLVPTLVQLELSKWLLREADADRADSVIARTMQHVVVPMDTGIALLAAELHQRHRLATADAIVYATAQSHGADLLTCDAHFDGLPGVVFHRKRG